MKDILYSGENCPPCKVVKQYIDTHNLDVDIVYFKKDFTLDEFHELGFRSTPSMITKTGEKIVNSNNIINYLKNESTQTGTPIRDVQF